MTKFTGWSAMVLILAATVTSFSSLSVAQERPVTPVPESLPIPTLAEATAMVKALLARATPVRVRHYCISGLMTGRTDSGYVDKDTGEKLDFYSNVLYSGERQYGGTGYTVGTGIPGRFWVFNDMQFDGQVQITDIAPELATLEVSPDGTTEIFRGAKFFLANSTKYVVISLTKTDEMLIYEGVEFDTADPNHRVVKRVEHPRMIR